MNAIEKEITLSGILKEVGVNPSLRGYNYIKEAVLIIHHRPEVMGAITKELYPTIAERFNATPSRVERCIRHAIEKCFLETASESRVKYFGNCVNVATRKVTCSTFIAVLVEAFNNEVKKGEGQYDSKA